MSKEVEKAMEMMNFLVINHENYTDEQFAERFSLACAEIPPNIELTHAGINKVITTRVLNYCEEKGIELKDYDGPMPYRQFVIPVGNKK